MKLLGDVSHLTISAQGWFFDAITPQWHQPSHFPNGSRIPIHQEKRRWLAWWLLALQFVGVADRPHDGSPSSHNRLARARLAVAALERPDTDGYAVEEPIFLPSVLSIGDNDVQAGDTQEFLSEIPLRSRVTYRLLSVIGKAMVATLSYWSARGHHAGFDLSPRVSPHLRVSSSPKRPLSINFQHRWTLMPPLNG